MYKRFFKNWLAYPATRGLDLDDPQTTVLRRAIIQNKAFLRRIYDDWYQLILSSLPAVEGSIVELGSGGGFLERVLPKAITSDITYFPYIKLVMDGMHLPFADHTLRAIVMVDVFHHIPSPRAFLREASRCVVDGGAIIMVEPWASKWSKWVYRRFHNEPFDVDTPTWEFDAAGPLSGANGALPWIVFQRDQAVFYQEFPEWEVTQLKPIMPIRYLLSGGVSMKSLAPGWAYTVVAGFEKLLEPQIDNLAMFAQIVCTHNMRTQHVHTLHMQT